MHSVVPWKTREIFRFCVSPSAPVPHGQRPATFGTFWRKQGNLLLMNLHNSVLSSHTTEISNGQKVYVDFHASMVGGTYLHQNLWWKFFYLNQWYVMNYWNSKLSSKLILINKILPKSDQLIVMNQATSSRAVLGFFWHFWLFVLKKIKKNFTWAWNWTRDLLDNRNYWHYKVKWMQLFKCLCGMVGIVQCRVCNFMSDELLFTTTQYPKYFC